MCDRFESAWWAGPAPRIEDYLADADEADRATLLGELLALERELRRRRGDRPRAEEYLDRFPAHAEVVHAAFGGWPDPGGGPAARPQEDSGRNLLFGILALQNNFISRDDLLAAFAAWVADKGRPLAQFLVDRRALDTARRALLEALVAEHIKQHGGDTEVSLAVVSSLGSVRDDLERLADPDLQASLAAAASRPAADAWATATYAPSSRPAGERFRVLRFHREGGLGRVYVARDLELGREVALKEIRPDKTAEAGLRDRFVLEAEINGGLEHPGIVPVYSLGTYNDGRPFYAMRFVEGDSLKEAIESYHKACPRPDPTAVEFRKLLGRFIDVCEAIAFAHSKGVLHRDLKPNNVMLGRFGETLLIDWGLAKATGRREPVGPDAAREATLVPPSGSGHAPTLGVLGTPPYMSPEQAAGEVESLGPATDVYGLGAILFSLLTGAPPVLGRTTEEVLERARRGAIRSPRSLNPKIPRALEAVCLKALAAQPQDRYPTALALAEEVEHWLADEPVGARRDPLYTRAWRWVRRHRTLATTAAALAVFGLIGLAVAYRREARYSADLARANTAASMARKATEAALAKSEESRQQAEAVSTFLVRAFRSPDPTQDGRQVKVADVLDRAGEQLDKEFGGSQATRGVLLDTLGTTFRGLGLYDRAVSIHTKARAVREAKLGPDHPDTLSSCNSLAIAYTDAGRLPEAIALHEATLKLLEAKLGLHHRATLASRNNLAIAYYSAGRLSEAMALDEGTLELREAKLGPDDPETFLSRNNLAIAFYSAGRLSEAIALQEGTIKLREAKQGPDHPETLSSRHNLAGYFWSAGRLSEAMTVYQETLRRMEAKLGPDHPYTLFSRSGLASVYEDLGRWAEAESLERDTLARRRRAQQPDILLLAGDLADLGRNLLYQARWPEAEPLLRECLSIRAKAAPDDWSRYDATSLLGWSLLGQGRCALAEPLVVAGYEGIKAREARMPVPDRSHLREAAERVVRLYEAWGKPELGAAWKFKLGLADLPTDVFARP
jgi:tetratricopeptide (TPR) repeat protein/tRNA A-37 threonylcarbamoyl transferase component Bud32